MGTIAPLFVGLLFAIIAYFSLSDKTAFLSATGLCVVLWLVFVLGIGRQAHMSHFIFLGAIIFIVWRTGVKYRRGLH